MTIDGLRAVRYRFGRCFRRRWPSLLAVTLVVALGGALAMATLAGARRTASSFSSFLAATRASDMSVGTAIVGGGSPSGYAPGLVRTISHLPHVLRTRSFAALNAYPLGRDGRPRTDVNDNIVGSVDGQYFDQDRLTVVQGRMADPSRPDEMVMSAGLARYLHLRVGDRAPWAVYPASATSSAPLAPALRIDLRLVGLVVFNDTVVQDQVDKAAAPQSVVLTPALTRRAVSCCSNYAFTYLALDKGSASVPAVEGEIARVLPPGLPLDVHTTATVVTKAQRALQPEAIALGVFGGVAAVATLLLAAQLAARRLRAESDEGAVLRALGVGPLVVAGDAALGLLLAVVAGALLAAVVAVILSPVFPVGPVRAVYPHRGLAVDWTVLGGGTALLIVVLSAVAVLVAVRGAPHRRADGPPRTSQKRPPLADRLARAGTPVAAVTGVRFALPRDDDAAAARASILGAAVAVTVVVATVVFAMSLNSLVSHPSLFGWAWDEELSGGGGVGVVPAQQAGTLLRHDPPVAAWAGYSFATAEIDGQVVPALAGRPGAPVGPPVLSGHGLAGRDEVVLGASTAAGLRVHLGSTVSVAVAGQPPVHLRVVGTATLPTIGVTGVDTDHLSMARGAWVPASLVPESVRNSFGNTPSGPNVVFVRFRPPGATSAAVTSLRTIARSLTLPTNYGVTVVPVQLPAEILNYRTMGTTPAYLGLGLAAGTLSTLGMTLLASVRRRRRDFAVLRTLGLSGPQLGACVAWQSTVLVVVGLLVGVPIGAALGRELWILFAHEIGAVPAPTVAAWVLAVVVAGALVLGNLVAAVPGRLAARTTTVTLLRD